MKSLRATYTPLINDASQGTYRPDKEKAEEVTIIEFSPRNDGFSPDVIFIRANGTLDCGIVNQFSDVKADWGGH